MAKVNNYTIFSLFFPLVFLYIFSSLETNEVLSAEVEEIKEGNLTYTRVIPDCPVVFTKSGRFIGSRVSIFELRDEPETFFNMFLRKFRILRR